jgi:hypothetical protein
MSSLPSVGRQEKPGEQLADDARELLALSG